MAQGDETRQDQEALSKDDSDSYGAEEGGSQEEEGEEGTFHSLRHVKRFAKEACRALDAAEAAVEGAHSRPGMTAALRRCEVRQCPCRGRPYGLAALLCVRALTCTLSCLSIRKEGTHQMCQSAAIVASLYTRPYNALLCLGAFQMRETSNVRQTTFQTKMVCSSDTALCCALQLKGAPEALCTTSST